MNYSGCWSISYLCWNVPVLVRYCKENSGCQSPFACKEEREQTLNYFRIWGNPEEDARLRDEGYTFRSYGKDLSLRLTIFCVVHPSLLRGQWNSVSIQTNYFVCRLTVIIYVSLVATFRVNLDLFGLSLDLQSFLSSFHYFFLRVFSSHSRTFHSFWDVIIIDEGQQILTYTLGHGHCKARGF